MYVHVLPNPPPKTRLSAIQQRLRDLGQPAYRFTQLLGAVRSGHCDFAQMRALPRHVRDDLASTFGPSLLTLRTVALQRQAQVDKILFENDGGARIETVLSRYREGWTSLCLSTQVGCGLGCTFCATGAVGLVRNLTAEEICEQVLYAQRKERVDSLAFMGMGEALANPHTFSALTLLTDPAFLAISPRRITVSTVGFAPGLERLVDQHPQVTVTLSVHSPFDAERSGLIPLQQRFPLSDNLALLDRHVARSGRKTYLAYLLIEGRNDTDEHLDALAGMVHDRRRPGLFHVSVIGYNVAAGADPTFRPPKAARVDRFVAELRRRGVRATRRQQFGAGIDAACGQLHARYLRRDAATGPGARPRRARSEPARSPQRRPTP